MRGRWFLILGVGLALAGGVMTYGYLRALDQRLPVLVATRVLRPREVIGAGDIRICYLPVEALHPDSLRLASQAIGRAVTETIFSGEQLHASRTDLGQEGRCVYGLEPSQRAMFVAAGFARAAGGGIQSGDRVDLVAVTSARSDPVAYRLALDLLVLELRDERGNPLTGLGSKAALGGALLAVPDHQVESIALALSCGHVYLVIRAIRHAFDEPTANHGDVILR